MGKIWEDDDRRLVFGSCLGQTKWEICQLLRSACEKNPARLEYLSSRVVRSVADMWQWVAGKNGPGMSQASLLGRLADDLSAEGRFGARRSSELLKRIGGCLAHGRFIVFQPMVVW
jgi:hypothetical protein